MNTKVKRVRYIFLLIYIMTILSFTACGGQNTDQNNQSASQAERVDTGFIVTNPESFDSKDTAVVTEINKDDKTVTLLNRDIFRKYTLEYDGTTKLYDKYGQSISMDIVQLGDMVDVTFLKSKKHLTSLQLCTTCWSASGVKNYSINTIKSEMTVGQDIYKLTSNTQFFSGGKAVELIDINPVDVLRITGVDSEIVSVYVEKGHGYLRLENDEHFIGGWIEVGQTMIQLITQDMLLTVPEGNYQVNISHKGNGGIKYVSIANNRETTLDIGDFEIKEPEYGTVIFTIDPDSAVLYVDGTKTDYSMPVSLPYGIHQLIVRAKGYLSVTKYLKVGQESAGISIFLEPESEDSDKDDNKDGDSEDKDQESTESTENSDGSGDSDQGQTSSTTDTNNGETSSTSEDNSDGDTSSTTDDNGDTVTTYYKVFIDSPANVEVYLDGNYIGISPCNFKKAPGSHVITLRKSGFETRSYTIQISDENRDETFSFVELEKE